MSRASRRSATPNACLRTTRQRSWEERCRRSTSGSATLTSRAPFPQSKAWRDGERGRRVAAELETAGAKIAFTQADVGTEAACLDFVNGTAQKFGRLDLLINNAG